MSPLPLKQLDDAVAEVFTLMLDRACTPLREARSGEPPAPTFLCASVRFSGPLTGACTVALDQAAASNLTEHLLGEHPLDDSLRADTVAELCNMIAGSWKARLPPNLAACTLSPPTSTFHPIIPPDIVRVYRFTPDTLTLILTLQ